MNPLSIEWTMGMNPEEKETFELIIRNNSRLVRRINEILTQWDHEIEKTEFTVKDFAEPNWAQKQAFRNGDRGRIKKLKDLFNI